MSDAPAGPPDTGSQRPERGPSGTLCRSPVDRHIAGVCGGIAAHVGVSSILVRATFLLVTLLTGGAAVAVYLFLWALTPVGLQAPPGARARSRRKLGTPGWLVVGGALLVLAGLSWSTPLGSVTANPRLLLPLAAVGAGAFVAWYRIDERAGRRWSNRTARQRAAVILQPLLGTVIAAAGVVVLVSSGRGLQEAWNGALAALAVLAGAGVIAAPFVLRLYRNLQQEQAERVRAGARADVAAHLHDSVLQTLALIQRRANDPQTVQRLARSQERELRSWLYAGQQPGADRLAGALTAEVHEVEDEQAVPVDLVVTGDQPMTADGDALVKATREALLNAVRHGRPPVSVYVEIGAAGAQVFVRDHGDGFDLADVAEDRLGVRESILGRMARGGGTAGIRRLEQGTEVALSLPAPPRAPSPKPGAAREPAAAASAAGSRPGTVRPAPSEPDLATAGPSGLGTVREGTPGQQASETGGRDLGTVREGTPGQQASETGGCDLGTVHRGTPGCSTSEKGVAR